MNDFESYKDKSKDVCCLIGKFIKKLEEASNCPDESSNTAANINMICDWIKDLAEADEKLWSALYHKTIAHAMLEADEHPERMGYDHYRHANGQFATKGHGHYVGYTPMEDWREHPYMTAADIHAMGYQRTQPSHHMNNMHMGYDDEYGRSYHDFKEARRYYTETHSDEHKKKMEAHRMEHLGNALMSIRDVMRDADPEMRKKMIADVSAFVKEYPST